MRSSPAQHSRGRNRLKKSYFSHPDKDSKALRFLLRLIPSNGDADDTDRDLRRVAKNLGGSASNTKTTSYGAVELDVFLPSRRDFDLYLAAVEPFGKIEFYRDLQEAPPFLSPPEAVAEAVTLFNAERFWEAHEVLESVWRVAEGEEKRLLQGLILVCAAFVHVQKKEQAVANGVARRALPLLPQKEGVYHGVDLGTLRRKLEDSIQAGRLALFTL